MDKPNRLLSAQDIAEMEKLTVDRVTEAIDAGDLEDAKKLAPHVQRVAQHARPLS
jgi:hypothetical protein